jgi:hypothetical protein
LVAQSGAQILDGVCAFKVGLGHWASDHNDCAVIYIGDAQLGILGVKRHDTAQAKVVEDGLNMGDKVTQLKV